MCDVDEDAVVSASTPPRIYDIPKVLHSEGLDAYVVRRLGLPFRDVDWKEWDELLRRVHRPAKEVTIALVGKYIDLPDAYLSVTEALRAGGFANDARVNIRWVKSDDCETPRGRRARARRRRRRADPRRVRRARHRGQDRRDPARPGEQDPAARHLPRHAGHGHRGRPQPGRHRRRPTPPSSTPTTTHPVISTMADQEDVVAGERDMGGTMRLGSYTAKLGEGTLARQLYGGKAKVDERHRHRYEVNNAYRERLEKVGLVFSGLSPDGRLVEYTELPPDAHPFFIGTQAHPEFRSRPTRANPMFKGLISAALAYADSRVADEGDQVRDARTRPRRGTSSSPRTRFSGPSWTCVTDTVRDAAATRSPTATTSSIPAPSRWSRSTTTTGSCSSGSTATRRATCCGSCPPDCAT